MYTLAYVNGILPKDYSYIEYNMEERIYKLGTTLSHHSHYDLSNTIEIELKSNVELIDLHDQLKYNGFIDDTEKWGLNHA